eukprot:6931448-Pyramimonas_sp.AAC.1
MSLTLTRVMGARSPPRLHEGPLLATAAPLQQPPAGIRTPPNQNPWRRVHPVYQGTKEALIRDCRRNKRTLNCSSSVAQRWQLCGMRDSSAPSSGSSRESPKRVPPDHARAS